MFFDVATTNVAMSQPIRIDPLLTDSLRQIKETLGQILIKLIPLSLYTLGVPELFWFLILELFWFLAPEPFWFQSCWYFSTLYRPNLSNTKTSHNKTHYIITYGNNIPTKVHRH